MSTSDNPQVLMRTKAGSDATGTKDAFSPSTFDKCAFEVDGQIQHDLDAPSENPSVRDLKTLRNLMAHEPSKYAPLRVGDGTVVHVESAEQKPELGTMNSFQKLRDDRLMAKIKSGNTTAPRFSDLARQASSSPAPSTSLLSGLGVEVYHMLEMDAVHLFQLDPKWLNEFPVEQQRSVFLDRVLPLLALQVNHNVCQMNEHKSLQPILLPTNEWISRFQETTCSNIPHNFIPQTEKISAEQIRALYDFLVLERAKVMFEKLWSVCEEWFLLGLACSSYGAGYYDTEYISEMCSLTQLELESTRSKSFSDSARDFKINLQPYYDQELPDIPDRLMHNSGMTDTEWKWNVKIIHANCRNFTKMKVLYHDEMRSTGAEDEPPQLNRPESILALGTLLQGEKWQGSSVVENIWRVYQQGPTCPKYGTYQALAAKWSITSLNVRTFCEQLGMYTTTLDPLENLSRALTHVDTQHKRDDFLLGRIKKLERENLEQLIMITSLKQECALAGFKKTVLQDREITAAIDQRIQTHHERLENQLARLNPPGAFGDDESDTEVFEGPILGNV